MHFTHVILTTEHDVSEFNSRFRTINNAHKFKVKNINWDKNQSPDIQIDP